ncbi:MAG TPA: XdhC family protein [Candidatus Angelobacter sp.]|nr:XdhC family protein [Candidatus Angelobacter sp.]
MWDRFLEKTSELLGQGASFAVATVVRVLPPTSGKPGDKAIIQSDGKLWGWIGGGCAQPVVIKEALKALADGTSRLVRISPSPNPSEEGTVDYTMTCHSGGALDIYIEPVLPKAHVVILGRSPVARTLAKLASTIGYAVTVVADGEMEDVAETKLVQSREYSLERASVSASTLIVVSTQGEGDEEALEQALRSEASYIGFVASRTKAQKVFDYLKTAGIPDERLNLVRAPAGLDIHAKSPEEIAVSILAQLIQVRSEMKKPASVSRPTVSLPIVEAEAKDPICGMTVGMSGAKHRLEYRGKMFFFCCAGCRQAFEREPARYASG